MLKERRKLQYQVLKRMFDETVGRGKSAQSEPFSANDIAEKSSLPFEEVSSALQYLSDESLIESFEEQGRGYPIYRLKHRGVVEIEQSMREPEKSTEHFPSQITQNFYGQVGAVQNASHSTAYVNQPLGANLSEVLTLIEQLKGQVDTLPEDQREDASGTLEAIEEELSTEEPKRRNVKAMLKGLASTVQGGTAFAAQVATLAQRLTELGVI